MGLLAALKSYWLRPREWEALCERCGRCCFIREVAGDGTVTVNYAEPCPFLDLETHECRTYERRFAACSECHRLTPTTIFFGGHLPDECAYVRRFRG